jgi:fructosamine-3-kinase
VKRELEQALGARVESYSELSGGDINRAFEVHLADGRRIFVKTNAGADPAMFAAEARGLDWLREAGAIRIPEVITASSESLTGVASLQFLALELITPARQRSGYDEELGRGLAALHRCGAPSFGLEYDNFIGRLPQPNAPLARWSDFYRERRLESQLARLGDTALRRDFDRLFARLGDLVGPQEPPARLHGDLWGGNVHTDEQGGPVLIDPAVYGGHREVDLAMMRLFGGFSERTFAAYAESFPLAAGHADRVALYQLYPLLVHANLFGQSYLGSVRRAVSRYV